MPRDYLDELFKPTPAPERWGHPACLEVEELLKQCEVTTGRATGGPGGQHRNKVDTQVFVRHRPSGIESRADEHRSQADNKREAIRRLRLALATRIRTEVPIGEVGSKLWRSRVRSGKVVVSEEHADYPSMLAEALDVIAAAKWDHSRAALRLNCTPTQLLKLVKDHPPALVALNRQRAERGAHSLK